MNVAGEQVEESDEQTLPQRLLSLRLTMFMV